MSAMRPEGLVMLQSYFEMDKRPSPEESLRIRIVIVERHAAVRRALRKRLSATSHLDVIATVQEPAEALPFLKLEDLSLIHI